MPAILSRLALALVALVLALASPAVATPPGAREVVVPSGSSLPGGDDLTLAALYRVKSFESSSSAQTELWVDPWNGSDTTGTGSYAQPWQSLFKIKDQCFSRSYSRCRVKGQGAVFSSQTLQLTFGASIPGPYAQGETVTWATAGNCLAGTGTVVGAQRNQAAVTTISAVGTEPVVGCVVIGSQSAASGTVADYTDTLVGLPSWVFTAAQLSVSSPAVVTAPGHPFADLDGPFLWHNQTTFPTTTGQVVTEAVTPVYICSSVAATSFQLSTSSACSGRVNTSSAGVGSNQLLPSAIGGPPAGTKALIGTIELNCAQRDRLCTTFEAEFPESPWVIDGGGFYPGSVRATIAGDIYWPGLPAGIYNPAVGGLFTTGSTPAGDLSKGWLGIENGVIQNLALDGIFTLAGGKVVALNVRCAQVRNGKGDRSQAGMANPQYQAHNSCWSATGVHATKPSNLASVLWAVNADGSSNEMGSDQASGGLINPNGRGALRIVTQGTLSADGIAGDTSCTGAPCRTSGIVQPGGDLVTVGFELAVGGITTYGQTIALTGDHQIWRFARMLFHSRGNYTTDDLTSPPWMNYITGVGASGTLKTVFGRESSIRFAGKGKLFNACPIVAPSKMVLDMRGMLVDDLGTYHISLSDCAIGGTTAADAVVRTKLVLEGIYDFEDVTACAGGNCFFYAPSARALGSCGSAATFLDDVCLATGTPNQWRWFQDRSTNSGGSGNGHQWGSPADVALRCQPGEPCYQGATGGEYVVDFSSYFPADAYDDACLPAEVLGAPVCALALLPTHVGAR